MNQQLRRKLDHITNVLWAGGVTNPVTYIEQISYLIFLKLLDEEESDRELRAQGAVIVPDILANSGGVMGSYFEWTQNIQEFSWPIEKFRRELDSRMEKAYGEVHKISKKYSVDLRTAAFIVSVERVARAFEMRGSLV